ncbi:O-antigen ligase family protein [Candidatus Daviesbacteria bacterium]|nr:O-antigen ligase family protein [Candidatus Daviesbacteria bacterium]
MNLASLILTFTIISGQLIKLPLGNGGIILLDVAVLALSVLGLVKLKFKLKKPPLFLTAALTFILTGVLSLILTPLNLQLPQYLISFSYAIRFCIYILLGWEIYSGAYPSLKNKIPAVLSFSGLILAILGLVQFYFLPDLRFLTKAGWDPHYFRAVSTFLDPNFLGAYLVLTLLLLFQNLSKVKKWKILTLGIIYFALLVTFSRGAYLAFFVTFTMLSFLNKSLRQMLLTISLSLGLLLGFHLYQTGVAQPRGINRSQSAQSRQNSWQQGWQLFQTHPIFGVGFNAYRYGLKTYNLGDEQFLKTHGSSTNDSSLLYVAATTGILGFLTYIFFLFTLVKSGWNQKFLPAALLGLIAQSFFANTLFYPPLLIWVILMAL